MLDKRDKYRYNKNIEGYPAAHTPPEFIKGSLKMTNVEYQTKALIREIKKSNVYNQYRRLQQKLSRDGESYRRIGLFRKSWFILQNKPYAPEDNEALAKLRQEYSDILENPDVREFLSAEQSLCAMVNQATALIYKSLDVDVSFLND